MQRSEQIAELAGALAKAQGQIEGAVKGNTNPAFRSKYADLGAVWEAIREPLSSNGLSILQQLSTEESRVACTTLVMHASGQFIEFAPFVVPVSKADAQGFGSAATYCRRYSLMAAVGIAPIDDDGNGAVGTASKPARTTPVGPPPEMEGKSIDMGAAEVVEVQPMAPGLLESAQAAAMEGRTTFGAFWKSASPEARSALAPHLESLKAAVTAADAQVVDAEVAE